MTAKASKQCKLCKSPMTGRKCTVCRPLTEQEERHWNHTSKLNRQITDLEFLINGPLPIFCAQKERTLIELYLLQESRRSFLFRRRLRKYALSIGSGEYLAEG